MPRPDGTILRYPLAAGELAPSAAPDTVVTGLPLEGGHTMHPFTIDPEGNLFVNSGSTTNVCQVEDRKPGSLGRAPLQGAGDPGGHLALQRHQDRPALLGRPHATPPGSGTPAASPINPGDGSLYATQHGRDQLAENWPKLFDWKQSAELPAEELLLVVKGGDYGWPYCYYDPTAEKLVLAPEYGGDGKQVGECGKKLGPAAAFPAHWAPNGARLLRRRRLSRGLPGRGVHRLSRVVEPRARAAGGYNVVFQPFSGGKPSGDYQVFADGFAGPSKQPGTAKHRPSGLAVGPDGALYISDDNGGRVWRVTHGAQ